MELRSFPGKLLFASCFAALVPAIVAQTTNSIKLFSDFPVEPSIGTVTPSSPLTFQKSIQKLSCPASGPIQAKVSSTEDGTGNVLVDNSIYVTVTPSVGSATGPTNICRSVFAPNCFATVRYLVAAILEGATGKDPDTYVVPHTNLTLDQYAGVPAIDIHSMLVPGAQQVEFDLVDLGHPDSGYFANSTLYLDTNCTAAGVTGPADVVNSPPPGPGTPQTFTFNNTNNQGVQFNYSVPSGVTVSSGVVEEVTDSPVDPGVNEATFQSNWVNGTPFATSGCILHNGELLGNGSPACKLYALECSTSSDPTFSGANCPQGTAGDELILGETFDPPATPVFTLPDIASGGTTFHTGMGLLMAPDGWTGGSCSFAETNLNDELCPQNLLYNFSGPGTVNNDGRSPGTNSTFISVYGVPEPLTTVMVTPTGAAAGNWVNTLTPTVTFWSQPPNLAGSGVANAANFVPANIQSITYGISPASDVPTPGSAATTTPASTAPYPVAPVNETALGDTVLDNPGATSNGPCPTIANGGFVAPAASFGPIAQTLALTGDGNYLLHYYAQDCAGTQELHFVNTNPDGSINASDTGNWSTNFYTIPVNVDRVLPGVSGPALTAPPSTSPATSFQYGQTIQASYTCTDASSGVWKCNGSNGSHAFPHTNSVDPVSGHALLSSPETDTFTASSLGSQTFTVTATDAAGNTFSLPLNYTVTGAPQTITFTSASQVAYPSTTSLTLAATATSGLPVAFSYVSGPGSVSGGVAHFTGLGTLKVAANQAGNAYYSAAPAVTQSIVVASALAPSAATGAASNVARTSATLNGTVNPNNASTSYWFSYGTSATALTSTTSLVTGLTGSSPITVSTNVTLSANTTYYYRLTAKSAAGGQTQGPVVSFTTLP